MTAAIETEVLGVRIRRRTRREALDAIRALLEDARPHSVYFVHAGTATLAHEDQAFREAINRGDLVLNDGIGIRLAARIRGLALEENLVGTDLVPALLSEPFARSLRVYLLGGRPGVAERAAKHLAREFPQVRVAGRRDGYFRDQEEAQVVAGIREAAPDLLLVGMGNPRQELFIDRNLPRLGCWVAMGVGGLLDHWSGGLRRASPRVRRWGLEWAQLLLQQPHKWRRYLVGNIKFLWRAVRPALRGWVRGGALAGVSVTLSLAAAEAIVRRVRPQILERYPPGLYVESQSRQYRLRPGFRGWFRYPEFQTEVRISRQGLREDREYGPPVPGRRRILAVGDSFTMGYSVSQEKTWVRVLERRLGPEWEVINAGTPGYSTWQEAAYLEEEGLALRPEIVLLGFFLGNDIADNARRRLPVELCGGRLVSAEARAGRLPLPVALALSSRLHLYHLAWRALRKRNGAGDGEETGWAATAGLLDRLARTCRQAGIRLVVVLMPEREGESRNQRMVRLCRLAGLETLDLTARLRGPGLYFPQDGHWTERGNALAAEGIYGYLTR